MPPMTPAQIAANAVAGAAAAYSAASASSSKPGWKTTEFWVSLLGALAPALNTAAGMIWHVSIPTDQLMAGVAAAGVYATSRSGVKAMTAYLAAKAHPDYKNLNQ